MVIFLPKKYFLGKINNKSSHSAVKYTPGRWTGNNIFFKGGLISNSKMAI